MSVDRTAIPIAPANLSIVDRLIEESRQPLLIKTFTQICSKRDIDQDVRDFVGNHRRKESIVGIERREGKD